MWRVLETPPDAPADLEPNGSCPICDEQFISGQAISRSALERMRRQKEILQTIFDHIPVMIRFVGPEGRIQLVNRHWQEVLGWSLEEARTMDVFAAAYPDPAYRQKVMHYVAHPTPGWRDFKTRVRDGRTIETSWSSIVLSDGTSIGFGQDITDRKRAEEKLKRNESFLAEAQQFAHLGSWNWDIPSNTISWSEETFRIFGVLPDELDVTYEVFLSFVHPEDRPLVQKQVDQALHDRQMFDCCYRTIRRDQITRILHSRGQVLFDEKNQPARMIGMVHDITEQWQAEERLRESEERFHQLAANIEGYFWLNSPDDSQMFYMSPGYEKITGRTCASVYKCPHSWTDIIHPEDRPRVLANVSKPLRDDARQIEYRIVCADGSIRWIRDRAFAVRNAASEVYRVAGIGEDITEQKIAEEELRTLNAALENAVEGIARLDTAGNYISVNRAYATMLGYKPEELLWRNWEQTVYPGDRRNVRLAHKRMQVEHRVELEVRGRRKDRSLFWKQIVMLKTHNKRGEWTGNYCFMKDVTERKLAEQALRASNERLHHMSRRVIEVQEEERRHLARELHDEIGQVLSAISVNLHSLGSVCEPSAQPRLAESIHIVDRAIQQVRNLSLDLRPAMLDELGFVSTLRWYADRQAQRAGFEIRVTAECSGKRLPAAIEMACYRVAQEALTNVVRYARATRVWVAFREDEDKDVVLKIRDNGVGFNWNDVRQRLARGASFGVQGMQERVELLGGRFAIESTPGGGTLVSARLPTSTRPLGRALVEESIDEANPRFAGGRS
jgi:PAS domain S-box-containing protein